MTEWKQEWGSEHKPRQKICLCHFDPDDLANLDSTFKNRVLKQGARPIKLSFERQAEKKFKDLLDKKDEQISRYERILTSNFNSDQITLLEGGNVNNFSEQTLKLAMEIRLQCGKKGVSARTVEIIAFIRNIAASLEQI